MFTTSSWVAVARDGVSQGGVPKDELWSVDPPQWSWFTENTELHVPSTVGNTEASTSITSGDLPSEPEFGSSTSYQVYRWLWVNLTPVFIFGGGICNILAVIVLRSRLFRGTGTTFLLTALAVADFTVLMNNPLQHWLYFMSDGDTNLRTYSDAGCRIQIYVAYTTQQWSSWTLVLVTAERAVSVWWPFKAKLICSRKRIVIVWMLVTLVLLAASSPLFFKLKLVVFEIPQAGNTTVKSKACITTDQYYLETVHHWTVFALYNAGPTFFIVFFNIFIIAKLMRPQIDRQNGANAKKTVTSVTVMLVVVSVIYVVTTMPLIVSFLGADTFFPRGMPPSDDRLLMVAASSQASYVNNSINFLLYCLTGSRFRKAMKEMFWGRCTKKIPKSTRSPP